jgi:protein-arginine kinase activator protein McsA
MTKEELAIEISILSSKIYTLVDLKKKLVDDERYEDAAKVRDYIISIREMMLIYSIMIEEEKKKQIG